MKDSIFEILMNFFEKSLSQIGEKSQAEDHLEDEDDLLEEGKESLVIRAAHDTSMRIFTEEEQTKFTKASYQFIMRMMLLGIIASETMELIINQLLRSDSRYVTLQETKWTIRNTLSENLTPSQLVFLDLVLYHKEDELVAH